MLLCSSCPGGCELSIKSTLKCSHLFFLFTDSLASLKGSRVSSSWASLPHLICPRTPEVSSCQRREILFWFPTFTKCWCSSQGPFSPLQGRLIPVPTQPQGLKVRRSTTPFLDSKFPPREFPHHSSRQVPPRFHPKRVSLPSPTRGPSWSREPEVRAQSSTTLHPLGWAKFFFTLKTKTAQLYPSSVTQGNPTCTYLSVSPR